MSNDRNAGRKPKLNESQLSEIKSRRASGESVAKLAAEFGISRQALNRRLHDPDTYSETRIDYLVNGELCSTVFLDPRTQAIRVVNYALQLSKRAFGYKDDVKLHDLEIFLEEYYFAKNGIEDSKQLLMLDKRKSELSGADFRPETGKRQDFFGKADKDTAQGFPGKAGKDVTPDNGFAGSGDCQRSISIDITHEEGIPQFAFSKSDRLICRTDTDGYQIKAISTDRRYFIKSQAVISGVAMRDWAVEIIASDLCRQLSIPCVIQKECRFVYEGKNYCGVYSDNFELDGYTFVSFERLLERMGRSSSEKEFVALGAVDKKKWCAERLSEAGEIDYADTLKYMLDLAVVDCLVGNIDRHTRNFGLFYNAISAQYETALVFDNGMGLFENDPYRDRYRTFEEAMRNVYISPYGEDPFDMLRILNEEFDLKKTYPGIGGIVYPDILGTPFAVEYERRILEICRRFA